MNHIFLFQTFIPNLTDPSLKPNLPLLNFLYYYYFFPLQQHLKVRQLFSPFLSKKPQTDNCKDFAKPLVTKVTDQILKQSLCFQATSLDSAPTARMSQTQILQFLCLSHYVLCQESTIHGQWSPTQPATWSCTAHEIKMFSNFQMIENWNKRTFHISNGTYEICRVSVHK